MVTLFRILTYSTMLFFGFLLWGEANDFRSGPYGVGFRVLQQYDRSRPYVRKYNYQGQFQTGERARQLTVGMWYPAGPGKGSDHMSFQKYVRFASPAVLTEQMSQADALEGVLRVLSQRSGEEIAANVWMEPTAANLNAEPAPGRFPLILLAQESAEVWPLEDVVLCEYLASHGYVILSSPRIESDGTLTERYAYRQWNILMQMQDLQFLFGYSRDLSCVDTDKLAVVGRGLGGLAAALFSMYNHDTDALISWDSRLGNRFGYAMLFKSSIYTPSIMYTPVLHVSPAEGDEDADTGFFDSLKYADVHLLKLRNTSKEELSNMGMLRAGSKENLAKRNVAYVYAMEFLNSVQSKNGHSSSEPPESPDPAIADLEFTRGHKSPPVEEEFLSLIADKGISAAGEVYREVVSHDPEVHIVDPSKLTSLANDWMAAGRSDEAISLMKLNVEMYPDYWRVYDEIGNLYLKTGNRQEAVSSFEKSLDLNPDNPKTQEILQALSGSKSE